jgi:hypothetical protein
MKRTRAGLTVSPPNSGKLMFDKLTMRFKPLKRLDLMAMLPMVRQAHHEG